MVGRRVGGVGGGGAGVQAGCLVLRGLARARGEGVAAE